MSSTDEDPNGCWCWRPPDTLPRVQVRIWANANGDSSMGSLATERNWIKWVGGNDTEINSINNKFYASVHLVKSFGEKLRICAGQFGRSWPSVLHLVHMAGCQSVLCALHG